MKPAINYDHLKCKCGGIIGSYNEDTFRCSKCDTEYTLYDLDYDDILVNGKTNWAFPIKYRKRFDMEDSLLVTFSSDHDDPKCCNLMVSRQDTDGVADILNSIDGENARTLYELLVDTFPGRTSR